MSEKETFVLCGGINTIWTRTAVGVYDTYIKGENVVVDVESNMS